LFSLPLARKNQCIGWNFFAGSDISTTSGGSDMTSDETLFLEFRRGSEAAFNELFARYREPLFGFFFRRLTDRERAEDLAQDTFVAVMKGRERYEPRSPVRSYLYGIALKIVAAEKRKRANHRTTELVAEPGVASGVEAGLAVRKALALLEDTEREIVMLREYEELSYAEIAVLLRIPVNTVRSRLFRARMALKAYLEPLPAGDETCR
jgi:RNA polymerase sigma-70 factor (ECF subfamily)